MALDSKQISISVEMYEQLATHIDLQLEINLVESIMQLENYTINTNFQLQIQRMKYYQ